MRRVHYLLKSEHTSDPNVRWVGREDLPYDDVPADWTDDQCVVEYLARYGDSLVRLVDEGGWVFWGRGPSDQTHLRRSSDRIAGQWSIWEVTDGDDTHWLLVHISESIDDAMDIDDTEVVGADCDRAVLTTRRLSGYDIDSVVLDFDGEQRGMRDVAEEAVRSVDRNLIRSTRCLGSTTWS